MSRFGIILVWLLIIPLSSFSQELKHIESKGDYYHIYSLEIDSGRLTTVVLPFSVTGIAFQAALDENFKGCYVLNYENKYEIHPNTHDQETKYEGKYTVSELILLDPPCNSFQLYSTLSSGKFVLHLYNAGVASKTVKKKQGNVDSLACSKPETIDQSVWRDGLPAPTANPVYTETDHIVIHHSAGSNLNTDHLSAIRTIYIYHTQTNGWDDIGYNYVVARDGTIYDGREGHGLIEEDFVKGAHFCSKNSNTMGISVLGTYTDERPPDTAIKSLKRLLSWKLHKDQLNPLDSSYHPRGTLGKLPVICGHIDGCATACPGDSFYFMLPLIREEVWKNIQNCPSVFISEQLGKTWITVFPQPATDHLIIQISGTLYKDARLQINDLSGKLIYEDAVYSSFKIVDISAFQAAMYVLRLNNGSEILRKLVLKR